MSRIKTTLDALKAQKRKALIPYVMAGFPNAGYHPCTDARHGGIRRRHYRTRRSIQ
jgi:hypothetical protein